MLTKTLGLFALMLVAGQSSSAIRVSGGEKGLSNAVVLIIRHAEKPSEGRGLSPKGEERAKAYVKYFQNYKIDGKPSHFNHLFASADSKKSDRPRLTLQPTADALHKKLHLEFKNEDYDGLVKALEHQSYGPQILICWHHGKIPDMLGKLGADPAKLLPKGKWPAETFDWVVELHFDKDGKLIKRSAKVVHEHLLPGDSAVPR